MNHDVTNTSFIRNYYFRFRQRFSRYCPLIYKLCERRKAIIKFVIAGCISGGFDLILLYFFYSRLGWNIVPATSLAFIAALAVSFSLQKFWTFRDNCREKIMGQLLLYFTNAIIGLNINGLLMYLLVNKLSVWYLLAQILVNLVIAVQNFLVYKFIIFKKNLISSSVSPPISPFYGPGNFIYPGVGVTNKNKHEIKH